MSRLVTLCARVAGAMLLTAGSLAAAELQFVQARKLTAADLKGGDQFGAAVAVGEGVVAVGAYLAGSKSGAVYLFRRDARGLWEEKPFRKLPEGQPRPGEWFGFDVALSRNGQLLAVGAPNPGGSGKVYLYRIDAVNGTADLDRDQPPSPGAPGDELGSSVSIDGNWLAIGARGAAARAGAVYVFPLSGSDRRLISLPMSQPVAGAELGQSVSLRGNTLAAGAPLPGRDGKSAGAVYRSTLINGAWSSLQPVPVPALEARAAFGYSVAVQAGALVVGAPLASPGGAVYRCVEGGGCESLEFPRNAGDQLGVAVAADGSRIVAGARGVDDSRGAAYLGSQKLVADPRQKGAELGFSAAIRGLTVVAGAFREGGTGAAYVFEPSTTPPVTLSFKETGPVEAREGASISVSIEASEPLPAPTTAMVSAKPGSAQAGNDYYLPVPIRLELAEGSVGTATVEVSILCDAERDGKETFDLKLSDSSGRELDSLQVRILNNPQFGIVVEPMTDLPLTTGESGGVGAFSVRLACKPVSDVRLVPTSLDPTEGLVTSGELLPFTPETWGQSQLVQVTGQDDSLCDGNREYTVAIEADTTDSQYEEISAPVLLTNQDDDVCVSIAEEACITPDDVVLYTVTLRNGGESRLEDGPGNEAVIELSGDVRVTAATTDRGVVILDYLENTVAWNGSLPVGGEALITILAPLEADAPLAYDACE